MKLKQISRPDVKVQSVINGMMAYGSILEYAEFYKMVGNSDSPRKKATASGGKFRAIDNDYSTNKVSPQFASLNLKIFGDKVEVDKAHERRAGDIPSERTRQLINFSEELGKNFQNQFFNGASTVEDTTPFNGLKQLMPAGQKITISDGLEIVMGNSNEAKESQQKFLEYLRKLIAKVDGGAQVLYMNEDVWTRLTTIAAEFIKYEANMFGMQIPYFAGIPIRAGGYDSSGNLVIPATETIGEFTTSSSVYAIRFGEKKDLTIGTSNGLNVDDLGLVGVHWTDSVELDADLGLLNTKAVAKLEGIVIS